MDKKYTLYDKVLKDKNGAIIKVGDICRTKDRFGDYWIAPITPYWHRGGDGSPDIALVFDANYKTFIHPEYSKDFEVIGNWYNIRDYGLRLQCNSISYLIKRKIWERKLRIRERRLARVEKNMKKYGKEWSLFWAREDKKNNIKREKTKNE